VGFSAPHFGHWLINGAPQSPQKFLSAGLSLPHLEQRINSPLAQILTSFITLPDAQPLLRSQSSGVEQWGIRRVLNFKYPDGVAFQLVEQPTSRLGALHPYGRGAQFG
jgi:hypothetical protein